MDRFTRCPIITKKLYDLVQKSLNEGPDFYDVIDQIFTLTIELWNKEEVKVGVGVGVGVGSGEIGETEMRCLSMVAPELFSIIEDEVQWWRYHTHVDDKGSEHWFSLAGATIDIFKETC